MKKLFTLLAVSSLFMACNNEKATEDPSIIPTPKISTVKPIAYNIIAQYPHDTASYTEGLELYNGKLYESGGDFINSMVQSGDLKTGKIDKKYKMGTSTIFGEGITILNRKLYQLTWKTHDVYVYDVKDITKVIKKFTWPYEGWGMTNNGTDLIITTGGTDLYFVDPATFKVKNSVHIHDDNGPVDSVNELEYVDGFVWGNVYTTKDILKIDPQTGAVVGKMSFNNLPGTDSIPDRTEYFNGIAYDSTSKSFFITGKRWPKIYEVKLN
jgi:glutaminyl-peptide cyclotransferase